MATLEERTTSQTKVVRERGRQRRATYKARARYQSEERLQSEIARTQGYQSRAAIAVKQNEERNANRLELQGDLASQRRKQELLTGTQRGIVRSDAFGTISLLVGIFFVMIIFYVIVQNGQGFGKLTGSVGDFIHGISSNQPLFIATKTGATTK